MPPDREMAMLPLVKVDGADLLLTLIMPDGLRLSVVLGSAEVVAIAGYLIAAARARMGALMHIAMTDVK